MATTYSNDLRRKLLEAYERKEGSLPELARRFSVSLGWAKKVSAYRTRTGKIDREPGNRADRLASSLRQCASNCASGSKRNPISLWRSSSCGCGSSVSWK